MVWNWPEHFERSKSHVQHGFWTAKTMTSWLSPYFDPEIVLRMVQHWLTKTAQDFGIFQHEKKSSSDQNNLPIQRGWVKNPGSFRESFAKLGIWQHSEIPCCAASWFERKKKAMEFWGLVCFDWVLDVDLNILKMRKHLLIFLRYASDIWGGNPCPCSQIPE